MKYPLTLIAIFISLITLAATDSLDWGNSMLLGTIAAACLIFVMEWQLARLGRAQDEITDDLDYVNQKWFTTKE